MSEAENPEQNCPFCLIAKGDIPVNKVLENDEFMAFLDINPASKGHTLIIPKKHIPIGPMLEPGLAGSLADIIKQVNQKLLQTFSKSTSIFIANGGAAGQKAPHLIVHIIPRSKEDGINLNPDREERKEYEKVHKEIVTLIGGNEKTDVLMEDDDLVILHPKNNFVNGEIKIFVRSKFIILEQVPNSIFTKMIQVANKLSALLFDKLKMEGTNILIQNGPEAGQTEEFFSINIIPRKQGDGIDLSWEPKETKPEEVAEVLEEISSGESKAKEQEYIDSQKKQVEEKPKEVEDDNSYLSKSLDRLP